MRVGTKSLLFGVHQFLLHPILVAAAWTTLYGVPCDPRLWVAFIVHDWGYWGKRDMDGTDGERHVELGARIMGWIFDRRGENRWRNFCLYHSRFRAKQDGANPSRLCIADKLVPALMPHWFYLPLARLSGEIYEYMQHSSDRTPDGAQGKYAHMRLSLDSQRRWHADVCVYLRRWVDAHRDGSRDAWTPNVRLAVTASGVWQ